MGISDTGQGRQGSSLKQILCAHVAMIPSQALVEQGYAGNVELGKIIKLFSTGIQAIRNNISKKGGTMKIESFIKMATKLESMKPKYESLICSTSISGWLKMYLEKGKPYCGLKLFEEKYFPEDRIWLLDKDYTEIYVEKGLAGLIAHIADINLGPIFEGRK